MSDITESQVRERLREVDNQIEKIDLAQAYLRQEKIELETAIRVFDRLHQKRPDYVDVDLLDLFDVPEPAPVPEPRKPPGIPTMADMILSVLAVAALSDGSWMEPKQITAEIRDRWWPEAPTASVGPIAWRMATKEGRLKKQGAAYTIPENETPAESAAGGSEQEPASTGSDFHPPRDNGHDPERG